MSQTTVRHRPARILAGLVLAGFGGGFALVPSLPARVFGVGLGAAGLGGAALHGAAALRERRRATDPYDLSRLWDEPLPEDDDEPLEPDAAYELVYCHRCGACASALHAFCPDCGSRLGY